MNCFRECTALETVTIANGVASISNSIFYGCTSLTDIDLSGVETIGNWAFGYCELLADVDLSSVTTIGNSAFSDSCAVTFYADKATVGESFCNTVTYAPYVVSAVFNTVSGSELSLLAEVYDVAAKKYVFLSIKDDAKVVTIPIKITNKQKIASYKLVITNKNVIAFK